MPKKGSKQPYKPKKEYTYSIQDVAELAGITRNALNVAKAHGKIDPEDLRSVVSFLTRRAINDRLSGDLFAPPAQTKASAKEKTKKATAPAKKIKETRGRK